MSKDCENVENSYQEDESELEDNFREQKNQEQQKIEIEEVKEAVKKMKRRTGIWSLKKTINGSNSNSLDA